MKALFSIILFLLLIFITNYRAQDTLTILHVSDTHSMLAPMAPRTADLKGTRGGIARAATVIGTAKAAEKNVLILHGGDAMMGDLFFNVYFGIAELRILKELGLDVMALGNHEFDLGPEVLCTAFDSSVAAGGFSVLSANTVLEDPNVSSLKKYVKPYCIKEFGKIKAGIFSLLTPATNLLSSPDPAIIDTGITAVIANTLTELIVKGCSTIILISHLGIENDKLLAQSVPGIDIIISSHDHRAADTPLVISNPAGTKTYIVQAGAAYSHIGKLRLTVDQQGKKSVAYELITLDQNIPEAPAVSEMVDQLIAGIETRYGPLYSAKIADAAGTFAEIADSLFVSGSHETPLGSLITDAFRWKTKTQIAIQVGGSLAQPIWAGPVVAADVFRAIGYGFNERNGLGFRLAKFKMKGSQLAAGLEAGLSMAETDDELFPQVSGMKFGYDINKPPFSRLLWATIDGKALDTASVYTVTSNEFLVQALPSMFGVQISDLYIYPDTTEFHVLAEYVTARGTITPETSDRVTPVEIRTGAPVSCCLEQNYPNPFNPSTVITVSLPAPGNAAVAVFNILGEKVAELFSGYLSTGTHKFTWNAASLPSGIYFCSMRAEGYNRTIKMILSK